MEKFTEFEKSLNEAKKLNSDPSYNKELQDDVVDMLNIMDEINYKIEMTLGEIEDMEGKDTRVLKDATSKYNIAKTEIEKALIRYERIINTIT